MKNLSLGFSPCPNDTFIFYALANGKLQTGGLKFDETVVDVEALNRLALRRRLDVTKVSSHAAGLLREDYCLLRSGGALGKGCGPLVVSREECTMQDLMGMSMAIPGDLTTAYLLLQLYHPAFKENARVMVFSEIMGAVKRGDVEAGLIIHEGRFTYPSYGLKQVIDLGQWWEAETGLPVPLGGIVAKRELGADLLRQVDDLIKESLLYAKARGDESMPYIKSHAQELDDTVIQEHIGLYVNDYSLNIGTEGLRAVQELFHRAEEAGVIPHCEKQISY